LDEFVVEGWGAICQRRSMNLYICILGELFAGVASVPIETFEVYIFVENAVDRV